MQSLPDQLYDMAALLKHSVAKGDLIGVMQLEARLNALLGYFSATLGGEADDGSQPATP
ncbi:hypothetical protein [Rhodococcus wratislaviensis]|uniref:hypothetical protein n=1 Tax=Rhodococcus wratislaviensis TaxID=44752 RepID=UPI003648A08D